MLIVDSELGSVLERSKTLFDLDEIVEAREHRVITILLICAAAGAAVLGLIPVVMGIVL